MERDKMQLFDNKEIRTVWDEEKEEWYFSVVDVVAILTDSVNPTDYRLERTTDILKVDW